MLPCGAGHETVLYCAINTDGPSDDNGPTARDLSLVFQLFSETSIHLEWIHDYLSMHIFSQCLFAAHLQHVRIDCSFDQNQHLITTRNGCS